MGSVGVSSNSNIERPTISGSYNATQEMKDFAMSVAQDMQKDFPMLSKSFEIQYNKYMGSVAGYGFLNKIELNGAYLKKSFAQKDLDYVRGIIAHELTHTMQDRIATADGIKGSEARDAHISKIWNKVVDKYVADHPGITAKDINKRISAIYGGGGHSRQGGSDTERMAVAVEHFYNKIPQGVDKNMSMAGEVGKYVIEELKRRR